jgi:hypothetical protein
VRLEQAFNSDGTNLLTVGHDADVDAYVTSLDVSSTGVKAPTMGAPVGTVDATSRSVAAYYTAHGSSPTTGEAHIVVHYIVATGVPT